MGKDLDACCEACRHGSDAPVTTERDAPALKATTLWLTVTRGNEVIREQPLLPGRTTIGRTRPADVRLDDGALSRVQCTFEIDDAGVTVSDNGSTCGTYLDGRKVQRGVLREGSWVLVGNCYLRVVAR